MICERGVYCEKRVGVNNAYALYKTAQKIRRGPRRKLDMGAAMAPAEKVLWKTVMEVTDK